MSQKDSLNSKYKMLRIIYKLKNIFMCLYIAIVLSSIWLSNYLWFDVLHVFLLCLYFVTLFSFELYNYHLEKLRIISTIEFAFNVKMDSSIETNGYYNNYLKEGIDKFNLSVFESVYFTKKIYEKGVIRRYISFLAFIVIFIVAILFSPFNFSIVICEVVFSCGIAFDIYKAILFHIEICKLFNNFDCIYLSNTFIEQKELLLAYTYQYEKLKSYISLTIDSKTFTNLNEKLSLEWNEYNKKHIRNETHE